MRLAVIKKTVGIYCNALKREGFKTPFLVTRAALEDVVVNKDEFHLVQLQICLIELLDEEFDGQSIKTFGLRQAAYDAVMDVLNEIKNSR